MALTSNGVGTCGADDNQAQAGHLVVQPLAVHENQRGEITTPPAMGALKTGGGKPGQGYPCVVTAPRVAATLTAGTSSAGVSAPGRRQEDDHNLVAIYEPETVVRRLTELECERLQGYPDDWTIDQKGSPRYRQLGNSVAVPVVEWVARGLIAVDTQLRGGAA